jgi:hypothetical protein
VVFVVFTFVELVAVVVFTLPAVELVELVVFTLPVELVVVVVLTLVEFDEVELVTLVALVLILTQYLLNQPAHSMLIWQRIILQMQNIILELC